MPWFDAEGRQNQGAQVRYTTNVRREYDAVLRKIMALLEVRSSSENPSFGPLYHPHSFVRVIAVHSVRCHSFGPPYHPQSFVRVTAVHSVCCASLLQPPHCEGLGSIPGHSTLNLS
jgi:hypothetical protein